LFGVQKQQSPPLESGLPWTLKCLIINQFTLKELNIETSKLEKKKKKKKKSKLITWIQKEKKNWNNRGQKKKYKKLGMYKTWYKYNTYSYQPVFFWGTI
jgi:hypothetical protein